MYEVIKYINENIDKKLTLDSVSKKFGYSKWYFCEKFKNYTKYTLTQYIQNKRMQLAVNDLMQGKKVIDIASRYGYEGPAGFNKAFFKQFGSYPTNFKKQLIQQRADYSERRKDMYHLSDRCEFLRNLAVNEKPYSAQICAQTEFWRVKGMLEFENEKLSNASIIANGIKSMAQNVKPIIADGELIVGNNFGDGEFENMPKSEEKAKEILKQADFTDEQIAFYFENKDTASSRFTYAKWDYSWSLRDEQGGYEWAKRGFCMDSNHSVIGYEQVVKLGFSGLLEKIEKYENTNGKSDFYNPLKTVCQAGIALGQKYSEYADSLIETEKYEKRKQELKKIAKTCKNVPLNPATNLMEAIQAVWFAHILNTWEDGINANSLGRLDQILYPYYKSDIENGVISKEEAFELICCLWIKLYRDYDVQQSCVGGCDEFGADAVNELSYIMLDATEELDFVRCLSVRYSKNTPKKFLKRALEVVGHLQKGVPFFFNDDVLIPALVSAGVTLKDARDYTQLGCVETTIPGKSNPHAVTGITNLLKALEYTFGNGYSKKNPEMKPGVETGNPEEFNTYEKLYQAVLLQIEDIINCTCKNVFEAAKMSAKNSPKPCKSLLTEGCIENGKDFNAFGAMYDYYQIMLGGIPNLADSLMVIKNKVYEQKKYSIGELIEILDSDFSDEAIRLEFINKVPKFGNDIDSVDSIAVAITDFACDVLEANTKKYGISFHAQPFTYLWMIDEGNGCAASPDGRRSGEIIAYSVSPMQGRDFNGLTALLNSLAKLPTTRTPGTTSAIVEIEPSLFTDINIEKLTDIFLAASSKGLCNVQFNTVDADTLIDAQKNPDKHKNLAVRVSGFSQKFNLIEKNLQDHIICRTKHNTL